MCGKLFFKHSVESLVHASSSKIDSLSYLNLISDNFSTKVVKTKLSFYFCMHEKSITIMYNVPLCYRLYTRDIHLG